jgi:phage terminase small subunit
MARDITTQHNLTELQRSFTRNILAGASPARAYIDAGYAGNDDSASKHASTLLHNPAVLATLHIGLAKQLQGDAVIARRVAMEILQDKAASEKVRADLAVKMLRLAGHVEPRAAVADNGPVKTLSEMSTDELRARAAQLEDEIASRAKPITPGLP